MSVTRRATSSAVKLLLGGAAVVALAVAPPVQAGAIVGGFNTGILGPNDDNSVGPVAIGFTVDFYGQVFTSLYVNNNGNITFGGGLGDFTPFDLTSTQSHIIAPFFGDVDTRSDPSLPVTYGTGVFGGRAAFGVNWLDVAYFQQTDKFNSFQLLLVDRSDTGEGNFDIVFNYDKIQWETGSASGGSDGLGGSSARVGYSNGTGAAGTFYELPGSAVNGAFLDSNLTTGLIHNSLGSLVDGRYIFSARNGTITPQPVVPEPASLVMSGLATLAGLSVAWRRRCRNAA